MVTPDEERVRIEIGDYGRSQISMRGFARDTKDVTPSNFFPLLFHPVACLKFIDNKSTQRHCSSLQISTAHKIRGGKLMNCAPDDSA